MPNLFNIAKNALNVSIFCLMQTGMISPSKLRMKLIGSHNQKRTDGSNCNSSRTSPSKLEDTEFVKNSLLAPDNDDFGEEGLNFLFFFASIQILRGPSLA